MGTPVVQSGKVIIASGNKMHALDDKTGESVWSFETPLPGALQGAKYEHVVNGSTPVVDADRVYVGSDNGIFYVLDLQTGKNLWEFKIGVPIKASPVMSGTMVVVSAYDGNIYAFSKPRE
jgi:outer membrane protein assembly factor BamB